MSLEIAASVNTSGDLAYRSLTEGVETTGRLHEVDETDGLSKSAPVGRQNATRLRLVTYNIDAFAVRALSARSTANTLDLMYYMWNADLTGMLLMGEVLSAADRGVRVRLLLDDIGVTIPDRIFRAIDSHPNVELRLFNPTKARENALLRGLEMVFRFRSVNRRMHNKAWISDGTEAIVGGRNVGDEYFDAGKESNFRDFDLMVVGSAAAETLTIFDDYWDSEVVVPIRSLLRPRGSRLQRLRQRIEGLRKLPASEAYLQRASEIQEADGENPGHGYFEVDTATVLADVPEKAAGKRRKGRNWLMESLLPVITGTRDVINITSPYFIPGGRGVETFAKLCRSGVRATVLTNSLAATDVAAVHAGYSRYRVDLLRCGVRLFELRAQSQNKSFSLRGSGQASLHTKAFSRDGRYGFIGSLNLDPRSISLNTEMGILFESRSLVAEMDEVFQQELDPAMSYEVRMQDGCLEWSGEIDGQIVARDQEPDARMPKRIISWLISWLPLEAQL